MKCYSLLLLIAALPVELHSQTQISLTQFGLNSKSVTHLAMPSMYFPAHPYLYATTDEGVHRRDLSRSSSNWVNLGMVGKYITAIDVQVWVSGAEIVQTPIVAVGVYSQQGDTISIYRLDGQTWVPADSGITDGISALASFASGSDEEPGSAYAAGISGFVFRSNIRSATWTEVFSTGIGQGFTVAQTHQTSTLKEVWIGGFDSHSYLAVIWKIIELGDGEPIGSIPQTSIESTCNAFAFHPSDSRITYAALTGAILRSLPGKATWQFTGLRDRLVNYYSLCADHFTPGHLFVVSAPFSGGPPKFWESFDDGETWQEIPEISALSPSMRLLADPTTAGVVYIATAGKGVWKYQGQTVSVATRKELPPGDYALRQNYPNPFNAETRMAYHLPQNMWASILVLDAAGKEIAVLHDGRLSAGAHEVNWNGLDRNGQPVTSGIYFCRLNTVVGMLMRKMLLVR